MRRGRIGGLFDKSLLFNLRSDPFERAEYEAGDYVNWFVEHIFRSGFGTGDRGAILGDIPGVSAAAEAGQFLSGARLWRR